MTPAADASAYRFAIRKTAKTKRWGVFAYRGTANLLREERM